RQAAPRTGSHSAGHPPLDGSWHAVLPHWQQSLAPKVAVTVGVGVPPITEQKSLMHSSPTGHGCRSSHENGFRVMNTSNCSLRSFGTKFDANDTKPICLPLPLTPGGMSGVPALACCPRSLTSTSNVMPFCRSRTKTSETWLKSLGIKLFAAEPNAT